MGAFEKSIIGRVAFVPPALKKYGFIFQDGAYKYETNILDDEFILTVIVSSDGELDTILKETDTGEPYVLFKIDSAVGEFVGKIRTEVAEVLSDIKEKCCDNSVFISERTKDAIRYIKEKYGVEPEFLWEKFPDTCIFRRKDNDLWFALVLSVNAKKLGIEEDKIVELLLVRGNPSLIDNKTVFIGWHMNKKSWISMILDERTPEEKLRSAIDQSFDFAKKTLKSFRKKLTLSH